MKHFSETCYALWNVEYIYAGSRSSVVENAICVTYALVVALISKLHIEIGLNQPAIVDSGKHCMVTQLLYDVIYSDLHFRINHYEFEMLRSPT